MENRFGLWHTHTLEDELTDLEEKLEEKEPYIRPKTIEMPPTFTLDETESEADLIVRWIPYDEKEIIPEHILLISIGSKGTNWLKGRVLPNIRAIKDRHEIYGGFELGFLARHGFQPQWATLSRLLLNETVLIYTKRFGA